MSLIFMFTSSLAKIVHFDNLQSSSTLRFLLPTSVIHSDKFILNDIKLLVSMNAIDNTALEKFISNQLFKKNDMKNIKKKKKC